MIFHDHLNNLTDMKKDIQGCELAITDKAKCILCKKNIAKGTPRLWVSGELRKAPPDEGIEKIKRFICHGCAPNLMSQKSRDYQKEIQKGELAKTRLTKQDGIKVTYYNHLKDEDVIKKVINDEIIQELEKEEDENENDYESYY